MNGAKTTTLIQAAMLSCIAAASFAAAPAMAIPLASSAPAAISLDAGATKAATTQVTRKSMPQLVKQQRMLARRCAKLGGGKLKSAVRLKLTKTCNSPYVPPPVTQPTLIINPPVGSSLPTVVTLLPLLGPTGSEFPSQGPASEDVTSVPEPGTLALFGLGLLGLGLARRRHTR